MPGAGVINTAKTAVIGLIGTAATGTLNQLYLCNSSVDDAVFGTTGTIPNALGIIRAQGPATVFVVCVGTGTPTPVDTDFIGTLDATTGARTGLYVFDLAYSVYGFKPRIFIAPGYSSLATVAAALIAKAENMKGCAYLDAPTGTIVSAALALRGASALWSTTSTRAKLLYPMIKDASGTIQPFSAYAAGLRAAIDYTADASGGGFWVSSSNHDLTGVSGLEIPITAMINDPTTEANQLNAQGITTVFNNFGTGFREWGNRNASFPTNTDPTTFECVKRTMDIIDDAIEMASMPYLDIPIIQAYVDMILITVNNYFNSLIKRGAMLEGSKCTYDPAKNSSAELAKGHIVFTNTYMSPTPAERITFDTIVDTSLLNNLQS
jgi:hypothetical protein